MNTVPCHECLRPTCTSEPQNEVWVLGWRSVPHRESGPQMEVWDPDTGLDSGLKVRVLGGKTEPCYEYLGPRCRPEPRMEVWVLGCSGTWMDGYVLQ